MPGQCNWQIAAGWFCGRALADSIHVLPKPPEEDEPDGTQGVPALTAPIVGFPGTLPRPVDPVRAYLDEKADMAYQTYTGPLTVDSPPTTLQGALVFFDQCAKLIASKNEAYGDAWKAQGWQGNVSRILSKAKRVENMLWRGEPVLSADGESVVESLKDLANLCYFTARNIEDGNRWGSR